MIYITSIIKIKTLATITILSSKKCVHIVCGILTGRLYGINPPGMVFNPSNLIIGNKIYPSLIGTPGSSK